jgi:hypothetical protein
MGYMTFPEMLRYQGLDGGRDEGCWLLREQSTRPTVGVLCDTPPAWREDCIQ